MHWEDFRSKRVALLGAGRENLSLVPHLIRSYAAVFLCEKDAEGIPEHFSYHFPEVKVVTGEKHDRNLTSYDFVFRSPGIPPRYIKDALKDASDLPIVTSATDLFLSMTESIVVGVTGTKGKGTTSTMIGAILEAASKKVVVAGNIGKPIFDIFNELDRNTVVVLELSSFQLEDLGHSPPIAVVLPIVEDHLQPLSNKSPNFHESMNDYVAAKAHITLHQSENDLLIFAADNPEATSIATSSKARKIAVSQTTLDTQFSAGVDGWMYQDGERLINWKEVGLKGHHLFFNATVAAVVALQFGLGREAIVEGIKKFKPLPHRLQEVGEYDGVLFVDDSYATAPDATIAALTAYDRPLVLLLGGSSKGASFNELADVAGRSNVKAIVTLGQEAKKIEAAFNSYAANVPISRGSKTMAEAVKRAKDLARPGDVVMLSPACASKDMFTDAASRGDAFQEVVKA